MTIKIVDLFAGPGGLGEGFSKFEDGAAFQILVSAEMEANAHRTLRLRSFFRLIRDDPIALARYYEFCNDPNVEEAFDEHSKSAWDTACEEARQLKLGDPDDNRTLDTILDTKIPRNDAWVLIGGPPCQAYSLVGRSRNIGKQAYRAEDDHRFFLYLEYFRIVKDRRPPVFVMENVEGILTAKVGGEEIFPKILRQLAAPGDGVDGARLGYRIHSLVTDTVFEHEMDLTSIDLRDFIVKAELFGIPQARHRVILLGVRTDIVADFTRLKAVPKEDRVYVQHVINDLPPVRSQLRKQPDSPALWAAEVKRNLYELAADARRKQKDRLSLHLVSFAEQVRDDLHFGSSRHERSTEPAVPPYMADWYLDSNLKVWLNHEARGHMTSDLRRYGYAATYADLHERSPKGHKEFDLEGLHPDHKNWKSGKFADRFRVQRRDAPANTVTSHISKDGHSFIHYDPMQCRSLTVREAARLQTFPDNYFFQGERTQQLHQVGNAVPPKLGFMIAKIVKQVLMPTRRV
ncbi:MAG: Modification methylase [Massilia sp.]|nr:Modification methylase [Massilia sp.]